jgi:hypothetical protein
MTDEPTNLDMRVRMIFDEDFNTMVFPKVKEMIFRLSSDSPFEIAAKALAHKNGHPELWRRYNFSILRKDSETSMADEDTPAIMKDH